MHLQHLSLTNFRLYSRLELTLPTGAILVCGANAQGKTSLIESIYYLATARSPWTSSDRQLLNWRAENDPLPHSRITADVLGKGKTITRIDITIYRDSTAKDADGSPRFRKEIKVNGVKRRVVDLMGSITVVMFLPQDLALIEGSPTDRRRYVNITLAQVDSTYAEALQTFDKALQQRNALLRRIGERQASASELPFWDDKLVAAGSIMISGRQRLLRELELLAQQVHRQLTGGDETLELIYQPSFQPTGKGDGQLSFNVLGLDIHRQLTPAEIAPQYKEALSSLRREEIQRGMTLVGPQRDELRFMVNGRDLGLYGSRGQARTAVLAIKLAEMGWMEQVTGECPVLLLDEFIAELDGRRRAFLLERIDGAGQSILTTTEPDIFTKGFLAKATVWTVNSGQIVTT
ncbi:MAG TPA: DNA replication/repair protein RecF [Aggregatilineales bacterium]|nr:DNA replication/repair protein RecF [Aggregatilineales bacterium]